MTVNFGLRRPSFCLQADQFKIDQSSKKWSRQVCICWSLSSLSNNLIDALGINFVIIETVCPGVFATFLAGDLRRWTIWQGLVPIGNT